MSDERKAWTNERGDPCHVPNDHDDAFLGDMLGHVSTALNVLETHPTQPMPEALGVMVMRMATEALAQLSAEACDEARDYFERARAPYLAMMQHERKVSLMQEQAKRDAKGL